jgi:AraC-like DNA-binding protein
VVVPATRHLLRARDRIDARFREPLDVCSLARVAHTSPAHFSRRFARAFGTSPHRYLVARRVERAKRLLAETEDSMLEIAEAVGFGGPASFATGFRRVAGVTPSAYRRLAGAHADQLRDVPSCVLMAWTTPVLEVSRNRKAEGTGAG